MVKLLILKEQINLPIFIIKERVLILNKVPVYKFTIKHILKDSISSLKIL